MVFEHGNRPDPRHEPTYGAEIARARQAEIEQRIGHGERDARHGIGSLRRSRRRRNLLTSGVIVIVVVGAWALFVMNSSTIKEDVALEDGGEFLGAFSQAEASQRAAEALGTAALLLPDEPAGDGLRLVSIEVERGANGGAASTAATYWQGLTYERDEQEMRIQQFAPGTAAVAPAEADRTEVVAGSTVSAGLTPGSSGRFYLVEGPGHASLLITVRGEERPGEAGVLAMIEAMLAEGGEG